MSIKKLLRQLLVFSLLEIGLFSGVRIPPEEIEKLLNIMNRTQVVQIKKTEDD